MLREPDCWPLPGLSGISKEYWVLQIGTERVNLLNPLNLKKKKKYSPKVSIHDRLEKIAKADPILQSQIA